MAKLHNTSQHYYGFMCPACECIHYIPVAPAPNGWEWNGSLDKPTLAPSILVHAHPRHEAPPQPRCHSFVRNGKIMFMADSTHSRAGQTMEIPEWPE